MARRLALEWNDSEARLVVASRRGDRVLFEQAFSVALDSDRPSRELDEPNIGRRIAGAMAARGVGRLDTLVAVGRSNIELRQLSMPPAPEADLPAMVRFQAMREFNALDETWLLDFVPIDDDPDQPRTVLAAAIGPELVEQIAGVCQTAGVKPQRLILRPCAAASLLCRTRPPSRMQVRLLVDLLGNEVDLTVVVDRKVIFLRTARLAGDPLTDPEAGSALLAQIRRTMAAVQNLLDGRQVTHVVLCGTGPEHTALAERVREQLATTTELFDPFEGQSLGRELAAAMPDHPGRFAPLVGMLLDELEQVAPAVDFLHPRQPPKPRSRRNLIVLVAVAASLLVAGFLFLRWQDRRALAAEVETLKGQNAKLDLALKRAERIAKASAEIEKWTATDVVWLDELRRLAERLPPAQEVMLTQVTAGASRTGGEIKIDGLAQSAATIDRLEQGLRDASHRVEGEHRGEDASRDDYPWQFSSSLFVPPEEP